MARTRNFLIRELYQEQTIFANNMGRILELPQAQELVEQFGSKLVRRPGDYLNYIEPPLPRESLEKLGEALVEFALNIDATPPPPAYEIKDVKA